MNNKKIDIIIPVYNAEEYLDELFNSLQRQSFQDYSLIVINDASTDNSLEILKKYKTYYKDQLIILENNENIGLSETRNIGIDIAGKNPAKYLAFLDSDDWIDDDYFDVLYNTAETYQADIVISGLQRFEDGTNHIICTEMINYTDEIIYRPHEYDEFAYINPCVCAKLFLFQNIRDLRFRSIKRSEDTCYFFEALPKLKRVKFTNQAKYHYRIRNSSLSGAIGKDKCDSMHEEFEKMLSIFKEKEYNLFKEQFETQVFIRSSCGGVCRLSFKNMKNAKNIEKREYQFLETAMPEWRNNRYLCFGKRHSNTLKQFMLKGCAQLYKMHMFVLFIWIYWFVSQVLGKDIRS